MSNFGGDSVRFVPEFLVLTLLALWELESLHESGKKI